MKSQKAYSLRQWKPNKKSAPEQKVYADEVAYNYLCDELENILYHRFGLKEDYENVGVTDTAEKEMLRSAIIAVSHIVYLNACMNELSSTTISWKIQGAAQVYYEISKGLCFSAEALAYL